MNSLLVLGFFATALLYASVGFGGGSTYTALLTLTGTDFRILPFVSLVCNVIVVTGGTIRFVMRVWCLGEKCCRWLLRRHQWPCWAD